MVGRISLDIDDRFISSGAEEKGGFQLITVPPAVTSGEMK